MSALPAPLRGLLACVAVASAPACTTGDSEPAAGTSTTAAVVGCPALAIDRAGLLERARRFSERHGFETTIAFDGCPPHTPVTCDAVQPSEYGSIATFLDQVDADLSRYPAGFFEAIHLDYFVFGARLANNDAEHDLLGGAVVPYDDHRSVLFISTLLTSYCDAPSNRRAAHHEIGHSIDIAFAGVSEGNWWTTMNPPGFSYGHVDFHAPDILDVTHPREGLITKYAGRKVAEDYAEIYTVMFDSEKEAELRGWLAEDPFLRAKFRSVVGALATKWRPFVEAMPNYAAVP